MSAIERLRERAAESRLGYMPGTPEKYPNTELRGFSILEAEKLAAGVDALYQAANEAIRVMSLQTQGRYAAVTYQARDALAAAVRRVEGE